MSSRWLSPAAGGRVKVCVRPTGWSRSTSTSRRRWRAGTGSPASSGRPPLRSGSGSGGPEMTAGPTSPPRGARRKIAEHALEGAEARAGEGRRSGDAGRSCSREAEHAGEPAGGAPVPSAPRLLTEDCTPERLAGLMAEQGGRMATLSPEGDVFDLMGGPLRQRAELRRLPEGARRGPPPRRPPGATLGVHRRPGPRPERGPRSRTCSRAWGRTPSFRGRGLLARFLYALPEPLGRREGLRRPSRTVRATYQTAISALLDGSRPRSSRTSRPMGPDPRTPGNPRRLPDVGRAPARAARRAGGGEGLGREAGRRRRPDRRPAAPR